jgi:site-specific DNA-cytosine methylase
LNKDKIILDLCGGTGSWSKPYREAGYDVRVITLPEYDVRTYEPPDNVYGILAAPPCTEFSVLNCIAEARDRDEDAGMEIVNACLKIIEKCNPKFWAMENPRGYLRKYMGKPALTFQPWQFGDGWTKATDLWGRFAPPVWSTTVGTTFRNSTSTRDRAEGNRTSRSCIKVHGKTYRNYPIISRKRTLNLGR